MKKIRIGWILLAIYLISILGCYKTIQWSYKNKWTSISPGTFEVIICFVPVWNTTVMVVWTWINLTEDNNTSSFFNLEPTK